MTLSTAIPSWFSNTDTGAPQLNNAASSQIEVLRAVLVTGFNVKAVTNIAVASGVATVTCATHGYTGQVGKLVLIAGASAPLLNGRKQPTSTGPNTFTYPAPGVADGTYTGTMEARRAPLGWTEEFAGQVPNVAVFRQSEVTTDRVYLRVSDVLGVTARIVAYETMSDANNGVGPTPTAAQLADGVHWPKTASAVVRQWDLVGSAEGIYWLPSPQIDNSREAFFAGGMVKRAASHPFGFLLCGNAIAAVNYTSAGASAGGVWLSDRSGGARSGAPSYLMRNYTSIAGVVEVKPVGAAHVMLGNVTYACSGSTNYGTAAYPNAANNGLKVCPVDLYVQTVEVGSYPGMLHIAADTAAAPISHGTVIDGTNDALGKKLLALSAGTPQGSGANRGTILFNMTDPWVAA
jgi:hypothetical protein